MSYGTTYTLFKEYCQQEVAKNYYPFVLHLAKICIILIIINLDYVYLQAVAAEYLKFISGGRHV